MTDTIPVAQLRAFVDLARLIDDARESRLLAIPGFKERRAKAGNDYAHVRANRRVGPREGRVSRNPGIDHCSAAIWLDLARILCKPASDFDFETRRGFVIACRLTGLSWADVQTAIGDVACAGSDDAGRVWAAFMQEPDERYVGEIYTACVVGQPCAVKVGFSTNVPKRIKALSRLEGAEVVALHHQPATMLHEWAMHMQLLFPIKSEWYPREQVPSWLLGDKQCEAA